MGDTFTLETGKLESNYTIPMILTCPSCGERHIDEQDFAKVPHHTHACQGCGMVWRPAKVNTHGVRFLPGYANADKLPSGVAEALGPERDDDWARDVFWDAVLRSEYATADRRKFPDEHDLAAIEIIRTRCRPIGNDITDEWLQEKAMDILDAHFCEPMRYNQCKAAGDLLRKIIAEAQS